MPVGNTAIDNLRLDEAFADRTHRPFNDCWTVRMDSELMVIDDDDNHYSCFSDNEDNRQRALVVINEHNKEIVLLAIDNKLIANHPGGIADCALFDDEQFRFVEFKTNAYGNSEEAVNDTFDKAVSQLKVTIDLFTERLNNVEIQFKNAITLQCHIVLSQRFPRYRAIKQSYQIAFADETGLALDFNEKTYWSI